MNERKALMQSILDDPEDDVARLVFADWLEENGEPDRAELIRLQIQLVNEDLSDDGHHDLAIRVSRLLSEHEGEWRADLPIIPGGHWGAFQRGFVHGLEFQDAESFVRLGERLCRFAPIQHVWFRRLSAGSSWVERSLARFPTLGQITSLDLDSCRGLGFYELAALARSPHLHRLRSLNLRFLGLLTMAGEILTRHANWHRIERLVVSGNYLRDDGLGYLVRYGNWPALRDLQIAQNGLTRHGFAMVVESPWPNLRVLNLTGNRLGPLFAQGLAEHRPRFTLQQLHLSYCELGDEGVQQVIELPWLADLYELRLSDNDLTDRAAYALAEAPYLQRLRVLHLGENRRISAAGLAVLRRRYGDIVQR